MSIQEACCNLQKIQELLLIFIEREDCIEENFTNLQSIFQDHKIQDNIYYLISTLHLITAIADNHYRGKDFFTKINRILLFLKESIIKYFSNNQIFSIFQSNKKIVLFLIQQKILVVNEEIFKKISKSNESYQKYFLPEIIPFQKTNQEQTEIPENYEELREIGENDNYICQLIQKDSIDEFISYFNQKSLTVNDIIKESIYETNPFLIDQKKTSLIEYAAFFGSIQIFKYLFFNNAKLSPSLWYYAIHGDDVEIISLIESKKVPPDCDEKKNYYFLSKKNYNNNNALPKSKDFTKCLIESIKCHHKDITNYIQNNYMTNEKIISFKTFSLGLKYYNFDFFDSYYICQASFDNLCEFDYPLFVDLLIKIMYIEYKYDVLHILFIFNKIINHFICSNDVTSLLYVLIKFIVVIQYTSIAFGN